MANKVSKWDPKLLVRKLRIVTGLTLLAFVTSHLLNASLGLISLEAMDAARPVLTGVWSFPPLGLLLTFSLLSHFLLGLWAIYIRPTFKTNAQDVLQIVTALCVVPLMATHAVGIMMADQAGLNIRYIDAIRMMWIDNPSSGLLQVILVSVVWLHGCAGFLIWLRSMEGAKNVVLWVYPFAIAVPVLALLGFSEAGRKALEMSATVTAVADPDAPPPQIDFARIRQAIEWTIWGSIGAAVFTLLARALRLWVRPNAQFELIRNEEPMEPTRAGGSMLDVFRQQDQPHASLCQGRGRCGTCAVTVLSSEFPLPDPSAMERQTLAKKGLPEGARLACQVFPAGGQVNVKALFPADYTFHSEDESEALPAEQGEVAP